MIEEALSDKAFKKFKRRAKFYMFSIGLLVIVIAVATQL